MTRGKWVRTHHWDPDPRDDKFLGTIKAGSEVGLDSRNYVVKKVEKIGYGKYVTLAGVEGTVCIVKLRAPYDTSRSFS